MDQFRIGLLFAAVVSTLPAAAFADEFYRCVDPVEQGVHYQMTPCRNTKMTRKVLLPQDQYGVALAPEPTAKSVATEASAPTLETTSPARYIVQPDGGFKKGAAAPTIRLVYDPSGSPLATDEVEASIIKAATSWNAGCNINLIYSGLRKKRGEAQEGYVVRWNPGLAKADNHGLGAAGQGGGAGIELNPHLLKAGNIDRVMAHEVGHVIGIGHLHEDPGAVMSYVAGVTVGGRSSTPSPSDYASCNLAVKNRFGIDYTPPPGKTAAMSDKDAAAIVKAIRPDIYNSAASTERGR